MLKERARQITMIYDLMDEAPPVSPKDMVALPIEHVLREYTDDFYPTTTDDDCYRGPPEGEWIELDMECPSSQWFLQSLPPEKFLAEVSKMERKRT